MVLGTLNTVYIFFNSSALNLFNLLNNIKVNAVGVIDVSVGVGKRYNLTAELGSLLCSIDSNITRAGNNNRLTLKGIVLHTFEHFLGVVANTVACSLCAGEGAAVGKALTRKNACKFVTKSLVLTVHKADFTGTCSDIACGNIGISADVL